MACPSVTELLVQYGRGDDSAMDRLLPRIYDELRSVARRERYRWRGFDAPGTESLVHEAYAKLAAGNRVNWESRAQFFCLASRAMRSILIDNARALRRQKRGGGVRPVTLPDEWAATASRAEDVLAVDSALVLLESREERLARVVECRVFGGLTIEETAQALELSPATVKRAWNTARAWLFQHLSAELAPDTT